MTLAPTTQDILKLVEKKTSKPVEILPDVNLKVFAKVTMATANIPSHILTYNPGKRGIDYNIAYECGFILRLYENPQEERFQFAATEVGRKAVRKALHVNKKIKRMGLPQEAVRQLADQMFDGIMTQLRSYSIGMRIDRWLWDSFTDLRDIQKQSIAKQLQDNIQVLSPQIKEITPPDVFIANTAMNSAYAIFFDQLIGRELYVVPYRSAGFENAGEQLLEIADEVPSDAVHDRDLVDAWAEELELTDWYKWIPFE
jgi:hypothetical protein